jgi:carbamoyl-phosphate synthase small subunit
LVIKDLPKRVSNFRSEASLDSYLANAGVVGIAGIEYSQTHSHSA